MRATDARLIRHVRTIRDSKQLSGVIDLGQLAFAQEILRRRKSLEFGGRERFFDGGDDFRIVGSNVGFETGDGFAVGADQEFGEVPLDLATGVWIGTPASISASIPPQTLAMEVDPFDSMTSLEIRMA